MGAVRPFSSATTYIQLLHTKCYYYVQRKQTR
jgi:hypothetical protein